MASEPATLRVAVDTNVLLSGIAWPRWPYAVLQHVLQGDFQLIIPEIVLLEAHPNMQRRFPDFLDKFELLLSLLDFEQIPIPSREKVEAASTLMRQPEDIPVALSVIAAKVDHFVTSDKDFTAQHHSTRQVREAIPNLGCCVLA